MITKGLKVEKSYSYDVCTQINTCLQRIRKFTYIRKKLWEAYFFSYSLLSSAFLIPALEVMKVDSDTH